MPDFDQKHIAIVEEDNSSASEICQALESHGFSVTALCSTGEEILELLKTDAVDLILFGISMKGNSDGVHTADILMKTRNIPVVYMVGPSDENLLQKAHQSHPYGFVYKPFDGKVLLSAVKMALYRHDHEKKLLRNEDKYRTLYNSITDGFIRTDSTGKIIECNNAFLLLVGYSEDELSRLSYLDLTTDKWHSRDFHIIQDEVLTFEFSKIYEKEYIRSDGSIVPVEIRTCLSKNEKGIVDGMWSIVRNISGRKASEEALLASEKKYRETIEMLPFGIYECDITGRITFANRQAFSYFGMNDDDFKHGTSIFDVIIPEQAEKTRSMMKKHLNKEPIGDFEYTGLRKDGSTFPLEIHSSIIYRNDLPIGMRGVLYDLTYRKKIDAELLKTNKLESVGLLAGGIAHDFNNILTAMLGNISLAKMNLEKTDSCYDLLNDAEKAGFRARDLTQQLLTFSRGGSPVKKNTLLPSVIHDSADFILRGSISTCSFSISEDLWPVQADAGQISQVIQNLIINANQAMPKGGTICVSARNRNINEGENPHLRAGRYIEIVVTDSGVGIPESFFPNIFDPYFTTKQTGSGFGLSICYSIIKSHAGSIHVDSKVGQGTSFTVLLPAADTPPETRSSDSVTDSLHGSGRILIMDDDIMIITFMQSLLAEFGYNADAALEGEEALLMYDKASAEKNPYSLVIMDLTIPGKMGGKEAISLLTKKYPSAKAIAASGYSNDTIMTNPAEYGFSGILPKPFTAEFLLKLLKEILCDKSGTGQ